MLLLPSEEPHHVVRISRQMVAQSIYDSIIYIVYRNKFAKSCNETNFRNGKRDSNFSEVRKTSLQFTTFKNTC